jgi:hypothetical protein
MFSILDSNTRNLHDDKKCPREAQGRPRNMSCLVPCAFVTVQVCLQGQVS